MLSFCVKDFVLVMLGIAVYGGLGSSQLDKWECTGELSLLDRFHVGGATCLERYIGVHN